MKKSFIMSNDIAWQSVDNGIRRKILGYDNKLMLVRVFFEKGAIGLPHYHIQRQVSYVESGLFEVTINGIKKVLNQGDSFFVGPNLEHGVTALEGGVLLDIFTPARKDFMKNKKLKTIHRAI